MSAARRRIVERCVGDDLDHCFWDAEESSSACDRSSGVGAW